MHEKLLCINTCYNPKIQIGRTIDSLKKTECQSNPCLSNGTGRVMTEFYWCFPFSTFCSTNETHDEPDVPKDV